MRIGIGMHASRPRFQAISGGDGSACSNAIIIIAEGMVNLTRTIPAGGELWFRRDLQASVNTAAIPSGFTGTAYPTGLACGSITGESGVSVFGPGDLSINPDSLFKVVGTPGASLSLTLTEQ